MAVLAAALRWIDWLGVAAGAVGAVCLAGIPVLILADIGYGLLTRASLTFVWEYAPFLMAACFFLGLAYTLRTAGHVRVALVAEHLPPRGARLLDIAATALGLYFAGYVTLALVRFASASFEAGSLSFTPTATPLYIPQAVVAFGALLLTLQLVARLVRLLIGERPDLPHMTGIPTES